jgi:TPR repeat protein
VSQTLNQQIGSSFFDYVARWRIEASKPLITAGDASVLTVEQGYADAQMNLGSMYENGKAVIQENGETVKWEGLSSDQETTGERTMLFSSVENILKDTVSAHMWWSISSTNGNPNAASLLERVEEEMTISQIAEATQRAKACMESNYQDCD